MNRDTIRKICIDHGYTIKPGQTDLKEYVYNAAAALLEAQATEIRILTDALWAACGDDGDTVNAYIESQTP